MNILVNTISYKIRNYRLINDDKLKIWATTIAALSDSSASRIG